MSTLKHPVLTGSPVSAHIDIPGLKVPHMGWNDLVVTGTHVLDGIGTAIMPISCMPITCVLQTPLIVWPMWNMAAMSAIVARGTTLAQFRRKANLPDCG